MSLSDFTLGPFIGSGAYGAVYQARWRNQLCAAKKIFSDNEAVDREIDTLRSLRHRHIIQFYAIHVEDGVPYLVMDFAEKGSLARAINAGEVADWPTRIRLADEIARGVTYIHSEGIYHRDLKSANVLLTSFMEVKLADFGLSTDSGLEEMSLTSSTDSGLLEETSATDFTPLDRIVGTIRWMAPELFQTSSRSSTKSDMYSLGMVMWEMAANCTTPFQELNDSLRVMNHVCNGHRESIPDDTPNDYRIWIERCWHHDPAQRPEANELSLMPVEDFMEELSDHLLSATMSALSLSIEVDFDSGSSLVALTDDKPELRRLAEKNDVESQYQLAKRYEMDADGDETMRDAYFWYFNAAYRDHTRAQLRLGEMYFHGKGAPKSMTEAALWIRKSADQANADAQVLLVRMYTRGEGVEKNNVDAADWCLKAAEQGHPVAQRILGDMYRKGLGVVESTPDAVAWYRKAAEQGNKESQFSLGWMLKRGHGIERCDTEAASWFLKAAVQGHEASKSELQTMCRRNPSIFAYIVSADPDRCVEGSHDNARYQLCVPQTFKHDQEGKERGVGVVAWYREATKPVAARALNDLAWMCAHGRGTERNGALAMELYQEAACKGEPSAQYNIGLSLVEGRQGVKDLGSARAWFLKAALQGSIYALERFV